MLVCVTLSTQIFELFLFLIFFPMAQLGNRPYHVVVWGGTGVVGRLVAEHLARDYQVSHKRFLQAIMKPANLREPERLIKSSVVLQRAFTID